MDVLQHRNYIFDGGIIIEIEIHYMNGVIIFNSNESIQLQINPDRNEQSIFSSMLMYIIFRSLQFTRFIPLLR